MTEPTRPTDLQFEHAEVANADSGSGKPEVICAECQTSLTDEYYHVNGAAVCANCRDAVVRHAAGATAKPLMFRAAALGVLAAIAGAAIYYGVIAATNLEIGLVAILIGYMVGWAVRKGAAGHGGRRYQILAVTLTYLSVALAYAPLAMKGALGGDSNDNPATADSTRAPAAQLTPAPSTGVPIEEPADKTSPLAAVAMLFAIILALPVMAILGSMPSGLISAAIIGFGMHQAWRMTAGGPPDISGPFKVGSAPA